MLRLNSQTFSPLRFLLRSTVKSSEPSIRLLNQVLLLTPQLLVSSTSTSTQTDVGVLRSSRVCFSKSREMRTQSHKELVEERANMILCSADVASALTMAGVLDYTPALNANLSVDDTGNTFAGVLQGKYRVYIDPYSANVAANQYYVVGYKGTSPYDAGLFLLPICSPPDGSCRWREHLPA